MGSPDRYSIIGNNSHDSLNGVLEGIPRNHSVGGVGPGNGVGSDLRTMEI